MSSPPANQLGDDGLGDDANASSSGASSAGPGAPWVPPGRKSVLVPLVGTDHNAAAVASIQICRFTDSQIHRFTHAAAVTAGCFG